MDEIKGIKGLIIVAKTKSLQKSFFPFFSKKNRIWALRIDPCDVGIDPYMLKCPKKPWKFGEISYKDLGIDP